MTSTADGGWGLRQLPAGRGAQERPPPYVSARNRPAREAEAPNRRVPFSNFWTIALGPLSQDFLGNLFLRSSGFPGRPPGGAGPSSRLCGARAGGPFFRFFGLPLGTPFPFFWTPRCAPRGKPCLLRRRPQPPICLRTSRGRGVPPIAPGTTSRASSSCFAGKPFTVRRYSRHVTARLGFACDQAKSNRIAERSYDDWDRMGCLFGSNPQSSSASRATADVWRDHLDNTFSCVHLHGVIVSCG